MESVGACEIAEGKILIPGIISHATNIVEHPELVAERILRYARLLGRENVIAGTIAALRKGHSTAGFIRPFNGRSWSRLPKVARLASKDLWT